MEVVVIILFVAAIVGGIIFSSYLARKRREAMSALASELGLSFRPDKDYGMDERYPFLGKLAKGSRRYAFNILSGTYQSHDVLVFDYHYETYSRDSKGNRQTHHHYFSFFILILHARFPELTITREGWLSKIAQFVGYDDIDFESAEFSKKFCVRSPDKKFAYDIIHARTIDYLLANDDLNVELDSHCLTLFFSSRLSPEAIRHNLDRLLALRQLIPDYVWKRS